MFLGSPIAYITVTIALLGLAGVAVAFWLVQRRGR